MELNGTEKPCRALDLFAVNPKTNQPQSTALLTDMYELTMLQAALADGTAERPVVCEVFARRLSNERRYGVVAGIPRVLDAVMNFRFTEEQLATLTFLTMPPATTCAITASPAKLMATVRASCTSLILRC